MLKIEGISGLFSIAERVVDDLKVICQKMKISELFKNKLTGPTQIVTDHGIRWGVQKQKQSNEKQMGVSKNGVFALLRI